MTVKIKRKELIMGVEADVTLYLPEELLLTRDRRQKADNLDKILKAEVEKINREYDTLDNKLKSNEIEKWRWLGSKIDNILGSTPEVEEADITNNYIWPALGQYLRQELKRGLEDKKRSGTKNDHYRKCWELFKTRGSKWITSWVGWDAFTDRGAQLIGSNLIELLGVKFSQYPDKLGSNDFKEIAKLAVKYIPTLDKKPVNLETMSNTKLSSIADSIYLDFLKIKGNPETCYFTPSNTPAPTPTPPARRSSCFPRGCH